MRACSLFLFVLIELRQLRSTVFSPSPAYRFAPLRSTRFSGRSGPFSAPLTLRSHALLTLRMGNIFWARADVCRLLFCKVTTIKNRQKIEGQLL